RINRVKSPGSWGRQFVSYDFSKVGKIELLYPFDLLTRHAFFMSDSPQMPWAARLKRRAPGKKHIEEKRQAAMLSQSPEVRDRPVLADFDGVLKDEWVLRAFNRSSGGISRRRQDLHPGSGSAPRTCYSKAAEATVAPNLDRTECFNLFYDLLPLSGI